VTDADTLLGPGSEFEGLLTFRGAVRVDGVLRGRVRASGRLVLGPEANVEAQIEVDELVVGGRLAGDVVARERIELLAGGTLRGALRTPRLVVADGAVVDGPCATGPGALAEAERSPP
jgi:cytoskeletal protein CcmA (bactofilin family)